MPRFRYRAYDASGAVRSGELTVENRQAALQALARKSEIPIELKEARASDERPWWQREIGSPGGLGMRALADFLRELASFVGSSLPVDEALRIMSVQPSLKANARAAVSDILERVTSGASLSEAMAAREGVFPPFVVRLVHAGEVSGSLDNMLAELSRHVEAAGERRETVISQLLYPTVLIVAALVALGIITTVLVPAVRPLFEDAGVEPPLIISVLAGVAAGASSYGVVLMIVGCAGLIGLWAAWRTPAWRLSLDRFALAAPFAGDLVRQTETARFSRTLAVLTGNGVPLTEALHIAAGVVSNYAIAAAVGGIQTEVERGGIFSTELQRSGVFSPLLPRLVRVGEETGQLETMLIKVAQTYERAVEIQLNRVMTLLTPGLTIVIGGFIGFLVISVMNAILSANTLIVQ
ncbi:MAG: type II secretion system F family protein [Hyphomicrobium sp.]|nr:type II secretion system F family protein [Hyphomicrobium sp.]